MSDAFANAARALFADLNLSRAAIYTPPVGDTVACRAIVDTGHSEPLDGRMPVVSTMGRAWLVLASDVTPEKTGVLSIDGEDHRITADPTLTGPNRLAWRCNTRLVEA